MENNYQEQELLFKAFCDINRLKIISYLQTGEKCACVLLAKLQVTQPTLSHHMKILEKIIHGTLKAFLILLHNIGIIHTFRDTRIIRRITATVLPEISV